MNKLELDSMFLKKQVDVIYNPPTFGRVETNGFVDKSYVKGFTLIRNEPRFPNREPKRTMQEVMFSDLESIKLKEGK